VPRSFFSRVRRRGAIKLLKQFWVLTLSILAGFSFEVAAASAATFQYDGYNITNAQTINVLSPTAASGEMGQLVLNGTGPNAGQTLSAWCLDVFTYLTTSGTYTVSPLTTAGSGGSNPALTAGQISEIGSLMVNGMSSNSNSSAATQLAIWMLEYGSNFNYNGVSSTVVSLALDYESNVRPGGKWYCPNCTVTLLSLQGDQTLGFGNLPPSASLSAVPLPATLPLFATGLGALGLLGWRRKRKRAALGA
jgi:PEP-CTERM motif-containing protein